MATTTTNFGWDIPQSTDLVKDGATAIAALGQDIDTAFVDLKGGTTGQVLAKASNTDLDYTWTTPEIGDITSIVAGTGITGGGTSGAVTVSFDQANYGGGQYSAGKNKIINGDFAINQRNFTSTTTSATYGFDRFVFTYADGTSTHSAQTFTAGTAPVTGYEAANYCRTVTTGQTLASAFTTVSQRIENVRTFAGQTVTFSFWAKAASGTPKIGIELAQNFGTGGSPSAQVNTLAGTVTISTTWTRYSATVAVPSISGKTIGTTTYGQVNATLWLSAGSDFNTRTGSVGIQSNTFDIWGVQVEAGSTATPFQTATGTIQGELAACQRYATPLIRQSGIDNAQYVSRSTTTSGEVNVYLPVQMRTLPTAALISGSYGRVVAYDTSFGLTTSNVTAISVGDGSNYNSINVLLTHGSVAGTYVYTSWDSASNGGFIMLSAEL